MTVGAAPPRVDCVTHTGASTEHRGTDDGHSSKTAAADGWTMQRMSTPSIRPRLVVQDGVAAIDFYISTIGATELHRFADPSGRIVDAELRVGADVFSLTEEQDGVNLSPVSLGGSPLLLTLTVDDADAVGAAMEQAGAEVVFPIDDQFYGRREGRLRDPFGHLWIVSQVIESLTDDEIDARLTDRT